MLIVLSFVMAMPSVRSLLDSAPMNQFLPGKSVACAVKFERQQTASRILMMPTSGDLLVQR
jgi:hypothetical protein